MSEITFLCFLLHFLHNFEAFSRMCVSGLVLDAEVPIYAIFTYPFSSDHSTCATSNTPVVHSVVASAHPSPSLSREGTLLHHLRSFYGNATRPFALSRLRYDFPAPLGATSAAASSPTLVDTTHPARKRADTSATLLEKAPASSSTVATATPYLPPQETLVLPFQLSMSLERNIMRRNLPYLRDSWTRIDVIAVATFWITCVLAQTGVERGRYHIGIFLVLSIWHGDHNPLTQALRGRCTMYDDLHPVAQFGALKEFAP
ncbi:hypothetical protein EI94DRAFT_1801508 [Lactarius quietus]|nr:hypothetical protein EI94DRAFT_1801508 [Lactarius quietus]